MKAIKINSSINISSGITLPAGSICKLNTGVFDFNNENNSIINCEIAISVFSSLTAYNQGKQPIEGISDFKSSFANILLNVTEGIEDAVINSIYSELNEIYPNQIEIISI
jgi:hypothetical protein